MIVACNLHRRMNHGAGSGGLLRDIDQEDFGGQGALDSEAVAVFSLDAAGKNGPGPGHIPGQSDKFGGISGRRATTDLRPQVAVVLDVVVVLDGAVLHVVANHVCTASPPDHLTVEDIASHRSPLFLVGDATACMGVESLAEDMAVRDDTATAVPTSHTARKAILLRVTHGAEHLEYSHLSLHVTS